MKHIPKKTIEDIIKAASDDILEKVMKRSRAPLSTKEALTDRLSRLVSESRGE